MRKSTLWLMVSGMLTVACVTSGRAVDISPSLLTPTPKNQSTAPMCPANTNCLEWQEPASPIPTPVLTPISIPACGNSKFSVPASVISVGEPRNDIVQKRIDAANRWSDELEVTLTISRNVFRYSNPISLQATITNSSARPIIFVQPQALSFSGGDFMPNTVVVNLVSLSGERIEGTHYSATILEIPAAPPLESFAMLPPGESCTTDLLLDWKNTEKPLHGSALSTPIPGGEYQIKSRLYLVEPGPRLEADPTKYVDIGAWMGNTSYSTVVTFTILPPE